MKQHATSSVCMVFASACPVRATIPQCPGCPLPAGLVLVSSAQSHAHQGPLLMWPLTGMHCARVAGAGPDTAANTTQRSLPARRPFESPTSNPSMSSPRHPPLTFPSSRPPPRLPPGPRPPNRNQPPRRPLPLLPPSPVITSTSTTTRLPLSPPVSPLIPPPPHADRRPRPRRVCRLAAAAVSGPARQDAQDHPRHVGSR